MDKIRGDYHDEYLESDRAKEFLSNPPQYQFDHEYVICPYCGQQSGDCWEWVKEHVEEMECDTCGGRFNYWAEIDVTYHASPIKEAKSGSEENPG